MSVKTMLIKILSSLTPYGYKCYATSRGDWGYIITPNDNVLYLQHNYFGGWSFMLEYLPSRECGSGCQCLKDPVSDITEDTVKRAETEGLLFAQKLGAEADSLEKIA